MPPKAAIEVGDALPSRVVRQRDGYGRGVPHLQRIAKGVETGPKPEWVIGISSI
jgi:hypothetical protein